MPISIDEIKKIMHSDIQNNNAIIVKNLSSDVALINQISNYIINSGGKRLRPLIVMLVSRALGYQKEKHFLAATIIEFIHTATLLHDDVVDESDMRRNKKTANNVFGNTASILTGDFLYSRAFQLMVTLNDISIMDIMAEATNKIAEGEVLQLLNCNNYDINEDQYMNVIYCKTAKLFEAACNVAAKIATTDESKIQAMKLYGKHLGNAFQINDDCLDYTSDAETMGKNIGDDLAEGKTTLPIIYALNNANGENSELIKAAIKNGSHDNLHQIIKIIKDSGAIEYAKQKAFLQADLAKEAIKHLDDTPYKKSLLSLADIAVNRNY